MGVCNCSMFCCTLLYVHSSIAIILMGKRELIALLNLFSWCLVMVEWLFLAVPRGCLQFCDCGISWSYSLTIFAKSPVRSHEKINKTLIFFVKKCHGHGPQRLHNNPCSCLQRLRSSYCVVGARHYCMAMVSLSALIRVPSGGDCFGHAQSGCRHSAFHVISKGLLAIPLGCAFGTRIQSFWSQILATCS